MKKKKNRGFTILELMITLVILGLFVALSLSIARTSIERSSFTSAFNQFVSDFYFARQLAARENKYVAIVFNVNEQSYSMRILKNMIANPKKEESYIVLKEVEPMPDMEFFDIAQVTNFAFSSTGVIRAYPVDVNAAPTSFLLTFFRKSNSEGEKDFEKTIQVFPSGGIKIEKSNR